MVTVSLHKLAHFDIIFKLVDSHKMVVFFCVLFWVWFSCGVWYPKMKYMAILNVLFNAGVNLHYNIYYPHSFSICFILFSMSVI